MNAWPFASGILLVFAGYCAWNAILAARDQHIRRISFWVVFSLSVTFLSVGILIHSLLGGPWKTVNSTYPESVKRTEVETVMEPQTTSHWFFFNKTEDRPVERTKEVTEEVMRTKSEQVFSWWYPVWQIIGMFLAIFVALIGIAACWRRFG